MTSRAWRTLGDIRKEHFRALFASSAMKSVFDAEFFKVITARHFELQSRSLRLLAIQVPLFLILVLPLIPIKINVSLFGLTPADTKGLREILLIVMSCIGLFDRSTTAQISFLREMLEARNALVTGKNKDANQVLSLAYGFNNMWSPYPDDPDLKPSLTVRLFNITGIALVVCFTVFVLCALFAIQVLIFIDIYNKPSFSTGASVAAIGFAILADLLLLYEWYARKGLFPYTDHQWKRIFSEWQKRDPEIYKNIMKLALLDHERKGILRQLFGRPTPIKSAKRIARSAEKEMRTRPDRGT